eukprot:scaffold85729_cov19-Tisochrysis_lutea.AAC.1
MGQDGTQLQAEFIITAGAIMSGGGRVTGMGQDRIRGEALRGRDVHGPGWNIAAGRIQNYIGGEHTRRRVCDWHGPGCVTGMDQGCIRGEALRGRDIHGPGWNMTGGRIQNYIGGKHTRSRACDRHGPGLHQGWNRDDPTQLL